MLHAALSITVHDTPDAIFDVLARVYPVTAYNEARWIVLASDGVTTTFFAARATEAAEAVKGA